MALGTEYIIKYLSDISGAVQGAKQIEAINANMLKNVQTQYGGITRVIGDLPTQIKQMPIIGADGKEAIKTLTTVGFAAETASGKFINLSTTTTRIGNDFKTTSSSVKDVTSQFIKGNLEAEKGNKVFSNLTDNIKQLAGRALLTIPIWIALRSAITGVFQGISGGVKDLIAFDLALQKIRNNLQGTPEEVAASFKKIRNTITETSKATGVSTEELAGAVKQFATLGFSANESLQGGLAASKLSIALFGNASDTAEAFAKALNILIDRSVGAKNAADQMNEAFALTSQLEETNNFEIKGVTEALNKFAGTAAGVGLTMNQTLQILAALGTAGRTGSEGATLLSTSFNQLLKNLPNLSKSLGLVVGAGESTFDIFTKILNKITELNNTPGGRNAAIEAISDIFGGARGIKIVQSLVAVKDILDKNIAILPKFEALNAKVTRTLESESGQAKILGNNLKEAGKAFVTALVGSEDFTGSLIKLNKIVTQVGEGLKPLASTLHAIFSNLGLIAGVAFVSKFVSVASVSALFSKLIAGQVAMELLGVKLAWIFSRGFVTGLKVLGKLALGGIVTSFAGAGIAGVLGAVVTAALSPIVLIAGVIGKIAGDALTENFVRGVEEKNAKAQGAFNKLIDGLKGNLAIPDLTALIEKLTLEQKPGDQGMIRQIATLRNQLKKQLEAGTIKTDIPIDIRPVVSFSDQQTIAKQVLAYKLNELQLNDATNVQLLVAKKLYTEQLGIVEDNIEQSQNKLDLEKAINEETKQLNTLQKSGMISNQLEFLKLQGATNIQVIEQRIELERVANIHQTSIDLLNNQLELNRAITEEELDLEKIQKTGLIENQLELLSLQGATAVQLVQQRIELERMYGLNQTKTDLLRNELSLNKEITKEKLNQNKVSSDSLKLFQIAQKFGVQTAQTVSSFLTGQLPLTAVEPSGRESAILPILNEFFSNELEQRKAQQFFFEGAGRGIKIPERRAIEEFRPSSVEKFKLPDISTQVGQINVEVKKMFKEEDTAKQILDSLIEAIRNNPVIENAINEKIDEY